jgi:23S rRNA pseudouridine1911/1915/1917 synthase
MGVLVHRIDKDTTGLLVAAKSEMAQFRLARQFFDRNVERIYTTLVWDHVEKDRGTITANIARHPSDRLRFCVPVKETEGRHAVTHYRVLERLGYVTLLECKLETGRTHQIRVHMEHMGHPVFGDPRYSGNRIRKGTPYTKFKQFVNNCFQILPRQALHAGMLGFVHPASNEPMKFHAPLPDDFNKVLEKWRIYAVSSQHSSTL